MTRRSERTRSGRYQRPPTTTTLRVSTTTGHTDAHAPALPVALRDPRLIATAPMLPPGSSLVRIAGGPASARARPVLRQPAVDRPGNPRLLLRDVDASLCQSLLRHRGQRHVRRCALGRAESAQYAGEIDVATDCRRVAGGRDPYRHPERPLGGGNDTFSAGQRHVGGGQRHPSPGQTREPVGELLAGAEAKALTPARWPSWHRSATWRLLQQPPWNAAVAPSAPSLLPPGASSRRRRRGAAAFRGASGQPCRGPVGHGR